MYLVLFLLLASFILIINVKKNSFFVKYYSTSDEFLFDSKTNQKPYVVTTIGIVFFVLFCISNLYLYLFEIPNVFPNRYFFFLLSTFFLTASSFYDDRKSLDPILRIIIQLVCVYVSLVSLDLSDLNLPLKLSMLIALIIWIYIINITNFIDGSDGFCALNVISFYCGILIINYFEQDLFSVYFALIMLPILSIFLIFNFPNAKIYMGDTGAVFLGFLCGYSFLEVAINTNFLFALILFIYPILDCSITLVNKVRKGYMPWARHGDYFFLELKKKTSFKHRKEISMYILKTSFIQNIINIAFLYLAIYLNNNLILIINIILALSVIFIFYRKRSSI